MYERGQRHRSLEKLEGELHRVRLVLRELKKERVYFCWWAKLAPPKKRGECYLVELISFFWRYWLWERERRSAESGDEEHQPDQSSLFVWIFCGGGCYLSSVENEKRSTFKFLPKLVPIFWKYAHRKWNVALRLDFKVDWIILLEKIIFGLAIVVEKTARRKGWSQQLKSRWKSNIALWYLFFKFELCSCEIHLFSNSKIKN